MLAVHENNISKIVERINANGGYILHIDALGSKAGKKIMSAFDSISNLVLGNAKILSENSDYIIPFLKTETTITYIQQNFTALPEIILNPEMIFLNEVNLSPEKANWLTLENLYYLGIIIASILFLYKITLIVSKIYINTIVKQKEYNLVILPKQNSAFSFFKYLFLGKSLFEKEHKHIIEHELTHIKEKHSIDLMYFELQKIVFWFNPFSYLFQNRISALHEFIADQNTIKQEDKALFFKGLLQQTFQVEKFSFINQYKKKSLIKKRIIMATKNKSKQILKLKYLLILPITLLMLVYTSCEKESDLDEQVFEYKMLEEKPTLKNSTKTTYEEKKMELIHELGKISFNNAITADENEFYPLYFTITKNGTIKNIDYSNITEEYISVAKKIIEQLPEMNSGKINNKSVNSKMMILLTTKVNEIQETKDIPFSVIDEVPVYKGCENSDNKKKCMSDKITKHVTEYFNIELAKDLSLSPGKKRISVQFKIDNHGKVVNVKARAPHPKLKEEAIRVIKLIPKMKPGKQDGKAVNVRYNLPITFTVE